MGFDGVLGEKKLRRLRAKFGIDFDRAWAYGKGVEAREIVDGKCRHYRIVGDEIALVEDTAHYNTCPGHRR